MIVTCVIELLLAAYTIDRYKLIWQKPSYCRTIADAGCVPILRIYDKRELWES